MDFFGHITSRVALQNDIFLALLLPSHKQQHAFCLLNVYLFGHITSRVALQNDIFLALLLPSHKQQHVFCLYLYRRGGISWPVPMNLSHFPSSWY